MKPAKISIASIFYNSQKSFSILMTRQVSNALCCCHSLLSTVTIENIYSLITIIPFFQQSKANKTTKNCDFAWDTKFESNLIKKFVYKISLNRMHTIE